MDTIERFINYVKIDTQADENSPTSPSTEKQKDLSRLLVKELKELGLDDAYMDEYGVVYAHLKGEGDKIGFNAHVDTALEVTYTNANPRLVKNYDGNDIELGEGIILSAKQFPSLKSHIGKDLVVTDGKTLLGADDKAGIAIIMSALEYIVAHPEIKHHNISICFTPDEEIGRGPEHFNTKIMDADYAFTIDGGDINNIDFENFNAQQLTMDIQGVAVHPGEGKNALVNALVLASEFIAALPANETPYDANYDEGYWHLNNINGTSESCSLSMILREFDETKLAKRDADIERIIQQLRAKWPKAKIDYSIKWQYENMRKYVEKNPRPLEVAKKALLENGLNPVSTKIRGGTDGATFSKMGLVTPNLGTGSANHHGRYEYLVVQDYNKMIDVVVSIMKL